MHEVPRWQQTAYYRSLPRWKQVLLLNPDLFILRYFPDRIWELKPFHLRLLDNALNHIRALTEYPAGHGKTTLTSTICPILEICRNPNIRIGLIAKNTAEGEDIMRAIQQEMTDNDLLVEEWGPFRGDDDSKAWSLSRIDVAKRSRRGKESTISMFGAGSKDVLGKRTDWTICDDVVTDQNSATEDQRRKLRDWFDMCVETGPEFAHSRLTVVGTRFHPNDLYGDLEELEFDGETMWRVQREDAIKDEEKQETLWPEKWPWRLLMMQKVKVGTLSFNKRYRNIAVDPSRMVFREEFVRGGSVNGIRYPGCLDKNFKVGDYEDNWRIVAGFDPAVGTSRHAKFCAHIVLAEGSCREHDRCFWVVDLDREQLTQPQQVEKVLAAHETYPLQRSIVEANSAFAGLLQSIHDKMDERGFAYSIEPHVTTRVNKPDPEIGVQSMSPWFERCAVHIPWGDGHSQRKMAQLVDELIMYPDSRTTDTVMAFWFAWRSLQISAPKMPSYNRLLDKAGKGLRPWSPRRVKSVRNPIYANTSHEVSIEVI